MWPLRAADIADIVAGALRGDAGAVAHRVTTDTRAGLRAGDLFVALEQRNLAHLSQVHPDRIV